ncbi:MAG: acyl-CoA dehydrogenase family protein [Planctomycetia bacterium]
MVVGIEDGKAELTGWHEFSLVTLLRDRRKTPPTTRRGDIAVRRPYTPPPNREKSGRPGGPMELELSDEQAEFVATTRRFLAAECPTTATRALEHDTRGFDPDVWARGAALGWTSLLVPESAGGGSLSEHGLADLVLVAEEMGQLVAPGPLVPVNVVAETLGRHGSVAQQEQLLPGLLDGSTVAAWCGPPAVAARRDGSSLVLDGRAAPVEAAGQASHLLVTVRLDGELAHVIVPSDAPGLRITPLDGLDLVRRFAEVSFEGVSLDQTALVGEPQEADRIARRQLSVACVLGCAETVGAIDRVFTTTLEYRGDRYSFGRPLSSYKALKHRVADNKMWLESCHAIANAAARAVAEDRPNADEVVSAAKVWIGPHATELVQDCIQLHGGIGVTWEHDLHLYLRRVTVNRATYGTPEVHADRIADHLIGATS